MGLTADTAIASSTDVEKIAFEPDLANLAVSSATVANALAEATNELIRRVDSQGIDPSLVDAGTVTKLKAAAVFYALYCIFTAQPQDVVSNAEKAKSYKARFEEQMKIVVVRTTATDALTVQKGGRPRLRNHDGDWLEARDPYGNGYGISGGYETK